MSALEADEIALDLLHRRLFKAWQEQDARHRAHRPGTPHLWQEGVDAAKLILTPQPEAYLSLSAIARQVYCSPYHLARLFRADVGLSLHQSLALRYSIGGRSAPAHSE